MLPGPVGLDTAPIVYFIEQRAAYLGMLQPLFRAVDAGTLKAVTSAITLLEVLVVPLRAGDFQLAARYEELLTGSRGLTLRELDRPLLRAAAELRAASSLRTPDALQIAAAMAGNCTALVTNDRALSRLAGLRVLQLDDYLKTT